MQEKFLPAVVKGVTITVLGTVIGAVILGALSSGGIIPSTAQQTISTQVTLPTSLPAIPTLAPPATWTLVAQQPLNLCENISHDYQVFWNLSEGETHKDNDYDGYDPIFHYFSFLGYGAVEIGAEASYHGSAIYYLSSQPEAQWKNVHPYNSQQGGIALCWDSLNGYRVNAAFVGYYDF